MTSTTNRLLGGALYYASLGWHILACNGITADGRCTCGNAHGDPKDIGKHPAITAWQNAASTDPGVLEGWWRTNPDYNVAVMCRSSGFLVIDVDPRSGGYESLDRLEELVEGAMPPTITAITGEYTQPRTGEKIRGKHMYYKVSNMENLKGNLIKDGLPGIDIKHNGYVLLNPSNHVSGVQYEWAEGRAPWEREMAEASEELLGFLRKMGGVGTAKNPSAGATGTGGWNFVNSLEWKGQKLDLEKMLSEGITEGSRAVDLYAMTCAIANQYPRLNDMDRMNIETMMIRFNHEMVRPPLELDGPNGLLNHVRRAIEFVAANPKSQLIEAQVGLSSDQILELGEKIGSGRREQQLVQPMRPLAETGIPDTRDEDDLTHDFARDMLTNVSVTKDLDALSAEEGGEMGKRTLTDTGNGRRLVDAFGQNLRYTPGLGWFHWNTLYWKPDVEELETREVTKRLASVIGAEANREEDDKARMKIFEWAKQAKSNARQSAAIESATSDPRIAVDVEEWDKDPYLLGVANGVVDLRTGDILQGRQDLHITRRAPIAYRSGFRSKRWEDFLNFATYGDKEFQEWLQLAAGYTLTGLRTHDVMFLVYGPAGSGKNTFVEALVKVLGTKQYAFPLDSMILAQGDGKANQSDQYHWAELRGRRMIWVDELPESERLKENSVKKLTGSSEISARSPGEKPFTFESQGKLWITTNHRPIITDDAMWRRIRPIPWMNVPTDPDPTLKEYLFDPDAGLPAVLSWAVDGAIKLLANKSKDNLGWCTAVSDAAEMYRKNEDRMGMFLEEETVEEITESIPVRTLYYVYNAWSEQRGERPMTQIAFTRKLQDRGVTVSGNGGRAVILGRKMAPPQVPQGTSGTDWDVVTRVADHNI